MIQSYDKIIIFNTHVYAACLAGMTTVSVVLDVLQSAVHTIVKNVYNLCLNSLKTQSMLTDELLLKICQVQM